MEMNAGLYFSDYFGVPKNLIKEYGAFNISLLYDLPLFIDPFLVFNSPKTIYRSLHEEIIRYLRFLRDRSKSRNLNSGLIRNWYTFSEVKENWLGFSSTGNKGRGLGKKFASALHNNLSTIFSSFGEEQIPQGYHLEKLCLISDGVGRDNISDFTTNLIKYFLLEYTQFFTANFIDEKLCKNFLVPRVRFNYTTESWETASFLLPNFNNTFVMLTPVDILTRDDNWINKDGLVEDFKNIINSLPDYQLRGLINNYLLKELGEKPKKKEMQSALMQLYQKYPELIDYYIRFKEENGAQAKSISEEKVIASEDVFITRVLELVTLLHSTGDFYKIPFSTLDEARDRANYLKHVIEDQDGYKIFYKDGMPIKRETDLHILYKLTWYASPSDINAEANNGRGPVDFAVSRGKADKSLVEFKLASNSKIKENLQKQVEVYSKAHGTDKTIKVIIYFTQKELSKIRSILNDLGLIDSPDVILIDARNDNKPSASNA